MNSKTMPSRGRRRHRPSSLARSSLLLLAAAAAAAALLPAAAALLPRPAPDDAYDDDDDDYDAGGRSRRPAVLARGGGGGDGGGGDDDDGGGGRFRRRRPRRLRRRRPPPPASATVLRTAEAGDNDRDDDDGDRPAPSVIDDAPRPNHRRGRDGHRHHRVVATMRDLETDCPSSQRPFVLNFQTDSYGSETSWSLRQVVAVDPTSSTSSSSSSSDVLIGRGPPENVSYGSFALYSVSYCLNVGLTYALLMEDDFGDGMCCGRGHGGYEYLIDSVRYYTSNLERTFDDYAEHVFTVREVNTPMPSKSPTEGMGGGEGNGEGDGGGVCVSVPSSCGCDDVSQSDYRGSTSTTASGYACQSWYEQTPHVHDYAPESYPNAGLDGNNFCRNPDGGKDDDDGGGGGRAWCYTSDPNVVWEYCEVPVCPTVPPAEAAGENVDGPPPTYWPTAKDDTSGPTGSPSVSN